MSTRHLDTAVLFTWEVNDRLKTYLKQYLDNIPKLELYFPEEVSEKALLELAPKADIMVGWRVPDQVKLAATKMQLFINPGVSIKHYIEFFRKLNQTHEVLLINGHGNSYFTAQPVLPFNTLENVVLSPHRAASPFDDLERWNEVIENILRFNRGERAFLNVVDLENEYTCVVHI